MDIQKNKIFFDPETGENIIITHWVHYAGSEEYCLTISKGFGASEKKHSLLISEHKIENYLSNLVDKSSVNLPNKNSNPSKTSKRSTINFPNTLKMEQQNNFKEMRTILFDTMNGLKDGTIKIETAKAIKDTAQVVINSVKVEVDYIKVTGSIKTLKSIE